MTKIPFRNENLQAVESAFVARVVEDKEIGGMEISDGDAYLFSTVTMENKR